MLLKIITSTLKKVLFIDDKNMQQVHNIYCSGIKTDFQCNFIVMMLTRMGLHTFMLWDCTYRRAPVCMRRVWQVQARVFCLRFFLRPFPAAWHLGLGIQPQRNIKPEVFPDEASCDCFVMSIIFYYSVSYHDKTTLKIAMKIQSY